MARILLRLPILLLYTGLVCSVTYISHSDHTKKTCSRFRRLHLGNFYCQSSLGNMFEAMEEVSPMLDEPNLPEFGRTTLSLDNKVSDKKQSQHVSTKNTEGSLPSSETVELTPKDGKNMADRDVLSENDIFSRKNSYDTNQMMILHGYFSSRDTILQRAVYESKNIIVQEEHGTFIGCWLLTMVDHWDNEKERLLLLYSKAMFIVKYDFIAMNLSDFECIPTQKIVRLTVGNLEYPSHSFTPKFQSIAGRFSTILRGCYNQPRDILKLASPSTRNQPTVFDAPQDPGFARSDREGVKISWGAFTEPRLTQLWNPWSKDIPWATFLSHPLFSTGRDPKFDVNDFTAHLHRIFQSDWKGTIEYKSIIMDTYVGIPALIHNYSQFGYYRVRGKVSF